MNPDGFNGEVYQVIKEELMPIQHKALQKAERKASVPTPVISPASRTQTQTSKTRQKKDKNITREKKAD